MDWADDIAADWDPAPEIAKALRKAKADGVEDAANMLMYLSNNTGSLEYPPEMQAFVSMMLQSLSVQISQRAAMIDQGK